MKLNFNEEIKVNSDIERKLLKTLQFNINRDVSNENLIATKEIIQSNSQRILEK